MLLLAAIFASAVPAAEEAAIFKAAGFTHAGGKWHTDCDQPDSGSYGPSQIDTYRDLNGDGRPEALVTEGGSYCYGSTEAGFFLLTKQANGRWAKVFQSPGIAEFLPTRGVAAMPDIEVGGPGFCFGVVRWNGKAYLHNRYQYEGKPCRPPR